MHELELSQSAKSTPLTTNQIWMKATLMAILMAVGMLVLTAVIASGVVFYKYRQFLHSADISHPELVSLIKAGWQTEPVTDHNHKNILILGVDLLTSRPDSPPLTDTMLLVSLNLSTGQINTLPLPRDIWQEDYLTKINALYYYGQEKNPEQPTQFLTQVIEEMIGLPLQHTLVLSLDQVAELINLVGGIEIDVPVSFVDNQYPQNNVDVSQVSDPKLLYESIEFVAGQQLMDGETAIKYMRSRHGNNDQNTDMARSNRQQQIMASLMHQLTNQHQLTNPELLGQLFNYYQTNFANQLSMTELIATSKKLLPLRSEISFTGHSLSVYPADSSGVIENPPQSLYQGQWVYRIIDETNFKNEVLEKLY